MLLANYTTSIHEVPGEVSLVLNISECPNDCNGCHSPELRKSIGEDLSSELYNNILLKYEGLITCVCFMGGEWDINTLKILLQIAKRKSMKTCLYTSSKNAPDEIVIHLDFIKTGRFYKNLGGLESPKTNQKFIRLKDNFDMTHYFQHKA